ncbi:MAG: hypothetical protein M0Z95_26310 [Actinomycetota bacterium]|nr:hypothetical protein [Actinomycetota bacterium]
MPDEPTPGGAGTGGSTAERSFSPSSAPMPPVDSPSSSDPSARGPWPHHQPPSNQPPSNQPPPGQGGYGQPPYGQPPSGQGGYGYGQPPSGHGPYGHSPYGQHQPEPPPPYGQPPYGGYAPPSGGYGPPPGGYGPPPGGYGPPPGGYGPPPGGFGGPGHDPYAGHAYNWPYVPPRPKRTPEEQRQRKRRLAGFLGIFVVFLGVGILIGALIAPTNPTTVAEGLVTKTMTAVTQAGSYHYVDLATVGGVPDNITGDASSTGGRQVITQRCATGTNVFDLRLVNGVVYFRGNGPAVVDQLGVGKSHAPAEVDKWVKVTKGEHPYTSFADGITAKSNISQLKTTIVVSKSTTDNRTSPPTTKVTGALRVSKTQYAGTAALVITTATSLPRSLTGDAQLTGGRYTLSWTFSHFHENVHVTTPAHTVPYASLHATPPPKAICG